MALSICLQSIERFVHIQAVDSPMLVLIVACVGLSLNILSAFVIHGEFLMLLIYLYEKNQIVMNNLQIIMATVTAPPSGLIHMGLKILILSVIPS